MGKVIAITRGKYIMKLHSHAESSPLARWSQFPTLGGAMSGQPRPAAHRVEHARPTANRSV